MRLSEVYKIKEGAGYEKEVLGLDAKARDNKIYAVANKPSLSAEEIAKVLYFLTISSNMHYQPEFASVADDAINKVTQFINSLDPEKIKSSRNEVSRLVSSEFLSALNVSGAGDQAQDIGVGVQQRAFQLLPKLNK